IIEVVIQKDRWKQAELEGRSRSKALDDLPGAEIFLVGIGTHQVEVELVGVDFGEEVAAAGEVFQIEELIFFEAMYGFHVALVGVGGGWDAHVLAVAESFGEITFEFATIVGLPDQIAQRNTIAFQVLLNARGEDRTGGSPAILREGPEQQTAANFPGGVLNQRQVQKIGRASCRERV